MTLLSLPAGLTLLDLYRADGLARVDALFLARLDDGQRDRLLAARADPTALPPLAVSDLIIELAAALEDFIGWLFGISADIKNLQHAHARLEPLVAVKRLFVQRLALKKYPAVVAADFNGDVLAAELQAHGLDVKTPLSFASVVAGWLQDETANAAQLDTAARYAAWAVQTPLGQQRHRGQTLFRQPRKIDPARPFQPASQAVAHGAIYHAPLTHPRVDFALSDQGCEITFAHDQAHYCIHCHQQGKDSCRSGLLKKEAAGFQVSPLGVTLAGCPLDEKISEMNQLRAQGLTLAALATVMIDNPLCAATGHRICNDCMKSCIYQKQQPVDIPQVETQSLRAVLALPWGVEIYSLLSRWNPLNIERPLPRPPSGRQILVVGQGPAGFNLAYHLLQDGHSVLAIDGMTIEPLPATLVGDNFLPVKDSATLWQNLDERVVGGFGGVAEYGITVRWDKNFLTLIRLLLERQPRYRLVGGVRFGGTLTTAQAWDLGFDHIALCLGAGKPAGLDIPGALSKGVRQASDFLMALQLTGAARQDSVANLALRLPVVVVGGGLTALDTACEALAYYPRQVLKFAARYYRLVARHGAAVVRQHWSAAEQAIADEWLAHAAAMLDKDAAAIAALVQEWGGVLVAYRRALHEAPSYRLNHEEVEKALQEGVRIADNLTPVAVECDATGHANALQVRDAAGMVHTLPARTILVAAGTKPNTMLAQEEPTTYQCADDFFASFDDTGNPQPARRIAKPATWPLLAHRQPDGRAVSYLGDLHPSFAGNVVKAMASAKRAYPRITALLQALPPRANAGLVARLADELMPRVHSVTTLAPNIIEVVLYAPWQARNFKPGQFYRLQNFATLATVKHGTRLAMEGLAMTGAWVDNQRGLLATIVLTLGGSSKLVATLKPNDPVVLMGPTGAPTDIPHNQTLLLIGGGLGNAVLFSIGAQARAQGCRVIYFAGYKKASDRFKVDAIEAAADVVVWCCDSTPAFTPSRPHDRSFIGNMIAALEHHNDLLRQVDHLITIGSDGLMAAVAKARQTVLAPFLPARHTAIGSINSPMQCMMKEICGQCIQRHYDPTTGAARVVFSCTNQDQALDVVDWGNLRDRLSQNSVAEKLTSLWVDEILGS